MKILTLLLLSVQYLTALCQEFVCGDGCVQLSTVSVLTFTQNQFSHSSDGSIYPQLVCVGGNACSESRDVIAVQCANSGLDDQSNVNWKCTSSLPKSMSLGTTTVACQGYRYPGDKVYIHTGSCKLLYSLDDSSLRKNNDDKGGDDDDNSSDGGFILFLLIAIGIIACCCCCKWCKPAPPPHRYDYINETIDVHPAPSAPYNTSYVQPPRTVVHNTYIEQPPYQQWGGYSSGPSIEIVDINAGNSYGGWGSGGSGHHHGGHHGGGGHHGSKHASTGFGGTSNF